MLGTKIKKKYQLIVIIILDNFATKKVFLREASIWRNTFSIPLACTKVNLQCWSCNDG